MQLTQRRRLCERLNPRRLQPVQPGANLAMLCVVGVLIIGMLGISIYVSLQAYVQNELQKAASTAAMAGAAAFYSGAGGGAAPAPSPGKASDIARQTFLAIVDNAGALKGFGTKLEGVSTNNSNDSVTVRASGALPTPFLAPVGITRIEVTADATARAMVYIPTCYVGPISIIPRAGDLGSASQVINLAFPMIDGPGNDIYIRQDTLQPYAVEACNSSECYDLVPGATPVAGGRLMQNAGADLIVGDAWIDLERAKVRKATKLRFTHGQIYANNYGGGSTYLQMWETPLIIQPVVIYGYAGMCPNASSCPVPAGFRAVGDSAC